ncbi:hypothetical protein KBY97_06055 [Synechococcus sp. ATX 2A4]|uniref:hypothetical protein n=1 Tax=Synechococcus sp. ATX 2A4 TaxID=2823727 RepID=UPI0020CC9A5A|nr:hypothetical protein [Synechococcus sp. ATX 2A4]MCP9884688.1 hypothetical protein [Synechococcus sp. ATX 2A4]
MPKAEYLKLFAGDTSAMVALFTSDLGWIENIPADRVFSGDIPNELQYEVMVSIGNFSADQLKPDFIAQHTNIAATAPTEATIIGINQIITNVSIKMSLSPVEARAFTAELFRRMRIHLAAGRSLDSSFAVVNASDKTPTGWVLQFK